MKKICIGFFFALFLGLFVFSANASAETVRNMTDIPAVVFTLDVDYNSTNADFDITDVHDIIGDIDPKRIYRIDFSGNSYVEGLTVCYSCFDYGFLEFGDFLSDNECIVYGEDVNWDADDFCFAFGVYNPQRCPDAEITGEIYLNNNAYIGKDIAAPKNIKAVSGGNNVTFSWNKEENADGYYLCYSLDSKSWESVICGSNSHKLDGFAELDNTLYYSVASIVDGKVGKFSKITYIDLDKLAAPQNISATKSASSVTVSWDRVSGADSYIFRYSFDNEKWTTKKTEKTEITVKDLKPGTVVYYSVAPVDLGTKGEYSKVQKVMTLKSFEAPKSVKATAAKESITVSWKKVSGATQYKVGYSYDSKNWNYKTVSSTSCKITGLKAGTKIYYAVQAISGSTTGAWSNTANITTNQVLPAPTNIKAAPDTYSFTVTWDKVSGADWYKFGYSTDGTNWSYQFTDTNSIVMNAMRSNTKYYYAVASVSGKSALSQTVGTWSSTSTVVTSAVQKQYYPGTNIPVYNSSYENYSYSDGVYTYSYFPEFPLLGPISYPMELVNEGFTSAGTDKYSDYTVKYFYNSRYYVEFLIPNSAWDYIIVKYSSVY